MSSVAKSPDSILKIGPSHRWVRAKLGEAIVVDCKRPLLVWEHKYYPTYFFPREHVRMDLLEETGATAERCEWNLTVNQQRVDDAAYHYPNYPALDGYIALRWDKLERWFEEDEEVFVHARDPYKRVDVMPSSRHVRLVMDGFTVAESRRPLLVFETSIETRYYIPAADVNAACLRPSNSQTRCPYKGVASYWHVAIDEKVYTDQVWSYSNPIPECPKVKGLYCFYRENVDMFVDSELQE